MFYCEKCGKKHGWPESIMRSFGPCEICGKTQECSDIPSTYLAAYEKPPRKKKAKRC